MNVYGKMKIKSCNFKCTHNVLLMKKIMKLREKISCKPTNSQNLAGMPTLHLLEAARSLLCAPAGGELKPSPSDEGEAGQKRLSPHGSTHAMPRGSGDLPALLASP